MSKPVDHLPLTEADRQTYIQYINIYYTYYTYIYSGIPAKTLLNTEQRLDLVNCLNPVVHLIEKVLLTNCWCTQVLLYLFIAYFDIKH